MRQRMWLLKSVSMVLVSALLTLLPGNTLLSESNPNRVWSSERIKLLIQDDLTDMICSLNGEAHSIDLEEEDLTDFAILDPVSFLDLNHVSTDAPEVIHLPLADKTGRIFAVFSVGRSETGYGRNFGQSFSRILESARVAGSDQVFLYQQGWDLYALDPVSQEIDRLNDSPQARASDSELLIKMQSVQQEYEQLCSTLSPTEKEDYIDNTIHLREPNDEYTGWYKQSVLSSAFGAGVAYPIDMTRQRNGGLRYA